MTRTSKEEKNYSHKREVDEGEKKQRMGGMKGNKEEGVSLLFCVIFVFNVFNLI